MAGPRKCLKCGADLLGESLEGFCSKCVASLAFGAEPVAEFGSADRQDFPAEEQPAAAPLPYRAPRSFGDYELLEEIARGGMGIVYKARQQSLDRIVAVKMLPFGPLSSPKIVQRFRTEASAAASLQHPNIVAIHEVGVHQDQHYFAMDYVEGPSLATLVKNQSLPARRAARYVKTLAEAIEYAHQRGILHRDLKPSNILIDQNDQPRVTDFGLAKRLEHDSELTLSGQLLGSPNYMPPEQAARKRGQVGKRSDIYSLGAILYHLLTGRAPFHGETLTDTLHQVLTDEPLAPRVLSPTLPADLETICLRCLEKQPERRYVSAQELADELGRFLRDEPIRARPVGPAGRSWRWCRRNPLAAGTTAVAATLLLSLTTGALLVAQRETRHAAERQKSLEETRRLLYAADMQVAQQAWEGGDSRVALPLLMDQIPRTGQDDLRGFEWRYLWQLCQGEQAFTFRQYTNDAAALSISPDGRTLIITENALHVVDLASRKELHTLTDHTGGVRVVAFSPTENLLISAGADDTIRFWETRTWHEAASPAEQKSVTALAFAPDGKTFASGAEDGSVQLWNVATRERAAPSFKVQGLLCSLTFTPHARLLLVTDTAIQLLDLATGSSRTIDVRQPFSIQYSTQMQAVQELGMHPVACSPDGLLLAIGGSDGAPKLYKFETQKLIPLPTQRPKMFGQVAFSPDGKQLALGSLDSTIELWDVTHLQRTRVLKGHTGPIVSLVWSPDGADLISASDDRSIRIWDPTPKSAEHILGAHTDEIWSVTVSPDGRTLASAGWEGKVKLWDTETWTNKATLGGFSHQVLCVAFAPDGKTLAASGGGFSNFSRLGEIKVWDLTTLTEVATLRDHRAQVSFVAFSADGRLLASADWGETARVWDVMNWQCRAVLPHENGANQLAFSPDGKLLAVGCWDHEIKLWDLATFRMTGRLVGHEKIPGGVWFSRDGRLLVSSAPDTHVKLWDIATRREIASLEGHKGGFVKTVVFSPDDKTIASGSQDGTINLWSVGARRKVATLNCGETMVNSVAFSPDGKTLYAGCADGSIRRWRAPSFEQIAAAQSATREATASGSADGQK
jgi:WD40 repeat protein/predicted Ser/Thr protein kinase